MKPYRILAAGLMLTGVLAASPKLVFPPEQTGPLTINLVQGYSFDPLQGLPQLPAGLSADAATGEYGYYLIQFPGPVRPEWKSRLENLGVKFLWYVPNYAFVARVPTRKAEDIAVLPEVRWMGPDQPAYKLLPGLEKVKGQQTLIVVFHYDEDADILLSEIRSLGATGIVTEFNAWNKSVKLTIDAAAIPALARIPGVYWIEPYGEITPDNMNMQWVNQHGYSASDTTRTIWAKGVNGSRMLVGITDTPCNIAHDQYRDPAGNTPGPTHRKVVVYRGSQGSDQHGTHTTATLCGSDDPVGTSWHDGLAKGARVFFQNYNALPTNWDMNVWFRGPDSGLNANVDSQRALNHSMSLSRKDTFNIYIFTDMTADQFVWAHPKFMHCNSMGNYGTNQMGHPVMAKNIISTGATLNGTSCRSIASYSSRGPTADGRRKPQLVSPGDGLMSASHTSTSGYVALSGTSMATPNMTASAALVRNYFQLGYYPTGDTLTGTPMGISAALNKAVLIVGADNDMTGFTVPDNNIGWGRVDLDSSLYFAGDRSKLWVMDDTLGLSTGDSALYTIRVDSAGMPFRVALVWTDYPGTMRAARILVNDLDLTVISPTGTEYKGSVYSDGQSQTGGAYDSLNVEECFRLNTPELGNWVIKVKARNVPQGPQPYALAAIGMFTPPAATEFDAGVTAIVAPRGVVDSGATVVPAAMVKNFGAHQETFQVILSVGDGYSDVAQITLDPGKQDTVKFAAWYAPVTGRFGVRCTTLLGGDENPANDLKVDSVRVRVVDVGVSAILAPIGTVDSGATVIPSVKVRNFGSDSLRFWVWFRIGTRTDGTQGTKGSPLVGAGPAVSALMAGSVYSDSVFVSVRPRDSAIATFRQWMPQLPDTYNLTSFTLLPGDRSAANDSAFGRVAVRRPLRDARAAAVLAPTGSVMQDTVITPRAVVENPGSFTETFAVRLAIGSFYESETTVTLGAGTLDTLEFADWTAESIGTYAVRCTTMLAADQNPDNDLARDSVTVMRRPGIAGQGGLPAAFALEQGRPTPFARETRIQYALPRTCRPVLQIVNSAGEVVRTFSAVQPAGVYRWTWNGRDERGQAVSRGIYYCRLSAEGFGEVRKLVKSR